MPCTETSTRIRLIGHTAPSSHPLLPDQLRVPARRRNGLVPLLHQGSNGSRPRGVSRTEFERLAKQGKESRLCARSSFGTLVVVKGKRQTDGVRDRTAIKRHAHRFGGKACDADNEEACEAHKRTHMSKRGRI